MAQLGLKRLTWNCL